jgi:hypothetical protein
LILYAPERCKTLVTGFDPLIRHRFFFGSFKGLSNTSLFFGLLNFDFFPIYLKFHSIFATIKAKKFKENSTVLTIKAPKEMTSEKDYRRYNVRVVNRMNEVNVIIMASPDSPISSIADKIMKYTLFIPFKNFQLRFNYLRRSARLKRG